MRGSQFASVTFAQPEAESLNQMRFCTMLAEASNIVGGGTAHELVYLGLAGGQYPAWNAGRVGEFLKQHGVMDRLMGVTIQQKTRHFAPQTKLVESLAGIMSGLEYLQDLNEGLHPLVPDTVAAHAWG